MVWNRTCSHHSMIALSLISIRRAGLHGCLCTLLLSPLTLAQSGKVTEPKPGIETYLGYDAELWHSASGIQNAGRYLDLVSLEVSIDGEQLLNAPGLSLYGSALYSSGHVMNDELLGTAQGVSNIETNRALRLYEAWAEWQYADRHSLKLGLYDLNSEFDAIDTAGLFINPSHGIGSDFSQSGRNGPSIFPASSLALRSLHGIGAWSVQAALLDGVPADPEHADNTTLRLNNEDGSLAVIEAGRISATGVRVAAGYWQYSARFEDVLDTDANGDPLRRRGNRGWYSFADWPVLPGRDERGALHVFARYGQASARINTLKSYAGVGAVYTGIMPGPQLDRLGLAIAIGHAGQPYRQLQAINGAARTTHETIVELTYQLPVLSWLTVQPDVQYIRNPGLSTEDRSSWAFGVRFTLATGW